VPGSAKRLLERFGQSHLINANAAKLRFDIGDEVECNMGNKADGTTNWQFGTLALRTVLQRG
jgi:hypothetical protein